MIGTVTRSTGSWCNVRLDNGQTVACRVRGRLKVQGLRATNPVAVGDRVVLDPEADNEGNRTVKEVLPRKNYMIRKSVNLSRESHIIAANIDQAVVVVTVASPRTSTGFIDRFLATSEAYSIPSLVVINKVDIALGGLLQEYTGIYTSIGYQVLHTSAQTGFGLDDLRLAIEGKVTLFSGHSGAGKSSLLNALDPDLDLRVGDLSEAHNKGTHTTTFAEMFSLGPNTDVIDTPGIKEFGLVDMNEREAGHYFREIFKASAQCRFPDCRHMGEPGCALPNAFDQGLIPQSRYASYLSIVDELSKARTY